MAYLLIVDDDPDFASSVATVCQSLGHEVLTVHTIQQARASLEQRRPDGLVLDVMFPEDPSAGCGLAREIRGRLGGLPVRMLTAVNEQLPLGFSNKDINDKW